MKDYTENAHCMFLLYLDSSASGSMRPILPCPDGIEDAPIGCGVEHVVEYEGLTIRPPDLDRGLPFDREADRIQRAPALQVPEGHDPVDSGHNLCVPDRPGLPAIRRPICMEDLGRQASPLCSLHRPAIHAPGATGYDNAASRQAEDKLINGFPGRKRPRSDHGNAFDGGPLARNGRAQRQADVQKKKVPRSLPLCRATVARGGWRSRHLS